MGLHNKRQDKILFIQPQTHMGKMLKPLQSEQANSWHLCALQQGTKKLLTKLSPFLCTIRTC